MRSLLAREKINSSTYDEDVAHWLREDGGFKGILRVYEDDAAGTADAGVLKVDATAEQWQCRNGDDTAYFDLAARRLQLPSTALTEADFALSAGWGDDAEVTDVEGSDSRCRFTVASLGTDQDADPTITITFADGAFTSAPFAIVARNGGDQPTVAIDWVTTTETIEITFRDTPVDTETYTFEMVVVG